MKFIWFMKTSFIENISFGRDSMSVVLEKPVLFFSSLFLWFILAKWVRRLFFMFAIPSNHSCSIYRFRFLTGMLIFLSYTSVRISALRMIIANEIVQRFFSLGNHTYRFVDEK